MMQNDADLLKKKRYIYNTWAEVSTAYEKRIVTCAFVAPHPTPFSDHGF